jgi:hypothetical protein
MKQNILFYLLVMFALSACVQQPADNSSGGITFQTEGGEEGGNPGGNPGGNTGGTQDMEAYPVIPDVAVITACDRYDYRGKTYNCSMINVCDESTPLADKLACCECYSSNGDPNYCNRCEAQDIGLPPVGGTPAPGGQVAPVEPQEPESCMLCHNGSETGNDYKGNGISNPHPFEGADNIKCTTCHGGDGKARNKLDAHVPAHPKIGNKQYQAQNPGAAFNRITLAGVDLLEPREYPHPNNPEKTYSTLDYLQFINPGDLRIVTQNRGCGYDGCHGDGHAQWMSRAMLATETGFFSNTRFMGGVDPMTGNNFEESLGETAPRPVNNPDYQQGNREIGEVASLIQQPEYAQFNGPMRDNQGWNAASLVTDILVDQDRPNRMRLGSNLQKLVDEQVMITCGDCHLYSAGQNNRYGDFRSSGCTACHMQYSMDGRSRSTDPNVNKLEPTNPDNLNYADSNGERAHVADHMIRNVAKQINGRIIRGINDEACVGCHQGSNRTVLQYWGIRLDQNADLTDNVQYPAAPVTFVNTAGDTRLFDPAVANNTFNGRNQNQYILKEDYDGDTLDDTPPDVHYEAGLGCIDCHSSRDVHNGVEGDPSSGKIHSHQDQATAIRCESCHGSVESYASVGDCLDYQGQNQTCAVDSKGNALRHVTKNAQGEFWLVSRLDGRAHYVPQTRDIVVNTQKTNPMTRNLLYSPKASYAMGRVDGDDSNGVGPEQTNPLLVSQGFSHMDNMDCYSCHATWVNNCIGCHLSSKYNTNPNDYFFSNITGERILLQQQTADFVYITPIPTYLGINSRGKITQVSPGQKMFYRYFDLNNTESQVFAFGDRLGEGNNPARGGRNAFPSLGMNQLAAHSIRGGVEAAGGNEPMRYCVTCHLTQNSINQFGAEYAEFRQLYYANDFDAMLNNGHFDRLREHIGQNTNNQLDSPFFVHMVAGLGTGLFLFDANGCPVNPFDNDANRQNCGGVSPADRFADTAFTTVKYDLDRQVEINGQSNVSTAHPMLNRGRVVRNAANSQMSGPLPINMLEKLADPVNGVVLDSWLDANSNAQGNAANFLR